MSHNAPPHPNQLDLTFDGTTTTDAVSASSRAAEVDEPNQPSEPLAEEALKLLVEQEGLDPGLVHYLSDLAVRIALGALHREALTNERETHGVLHYCLQKYGAEGCYHLCGIMEASHRRDPGDGWETLEYALPGSEWKPFTAIAEGWRDQRSEARQRMDKSYEDEVRERANS